MLVNELDVSPKQLVKVLHYDGTPITARFIVKAIREHLQPAVVAEPLFPLHKEAA